MVSKYDVFYVIATKGEIRSFEIVEALNMLKSEYKAVFNHVLELERDGYIERNKTIKVLPTEKSKKLFGLISFCIDHSINYNLMFKKTMLNFIEKIAKKEFFTIKDTTVHPQTFKYYIDILEKYGLLFVLSKKPLKCKLLWHHFLIDLMKFFNKKLIFYTPQNHSFIKEIEKELRKYKRNLKIYYMAIENLEKKEEIGFIYTSLNLEGNPLTLPETQRLIEKEIVPKEHKLEDIQEVTHYKRAIDLMITNAKKGIKLNSHLMLEYHKITMSHMKDAGKIRKQNVTIPLNPDFKTAEWKEIPNKLGRLIEKYNNFESQKRDLKEIIEFSAFFHNEFQRIHPFIDGNSRMARLLLLHLLRSHKIPILDLPLGYFDLYLDLTKRSKKRDDVALKYLIEELIFINLKKINFTIQQRT